MGGGSFTKEDHSCVTLLRFCQSTIHKSVHSYRFMGQIFVHSNRDTGTTSSSATSIYNFFIHAVEGRGKSQCNPYSKKFLFLVILNTLNRNDQVKLP